MPPGICNCLFSILYIIIRILVNFRHWYLIQLDKQSVKIQFLFRVTFLA